MEIKAVPSPYYNTHTNTIAPTIDFIPSAIPPGAPAFTGVEVLVVPPEEVPVAPVPEAYEPVMLVIVVPLPSEPMDPDCVVVDAAAEDFTAPLQKPSLHRLKAHCASDWQTALKFPQINWSIEFDA